MIENGCEGVRVECVQVKGRETQNVGKPLYLGGCWAILGA